MDDLQSNLADSMSKEEWLTEEEVQHLTGAKQRNRQKQILERYGLRYFQRPDGRLILSRWAVRYAAAGLERSSPDAGIRWSKKADLTFLSAPKVRPPVKKSP
jgi:hypothetical protein